MSFQVSPGVRVREIDATNVIPAVSTSIGAFAGPFRWGPGGQAVTVSSEKELASNFGAPNGDDGDLDRSFLTAASFLRYSNFLRVSRAIADDARNAASDEIAGDPISNKEVFDNASSNAPIGFHARYPGKIGNSIGVEIVTAPGQDSEIDNRDFDFTPGTTEFGESEGISNDEIHIRIIDVDGEITGTAGTVLETYQGLSLLQNAQLSDGRANYYVDVINERSGFVYVTNLVTTDPSGELPFRFYFDGSSFNVIGEGTTVLAKSQIFNSNVETTSTVSFGDGSVEGAPIVRDFNVQLVAGTLYDGANVASGNNLRVDLFKNTNEDTVAEAELVITNNQRINITTEEATEEFNDTSIEVFLGDSESVTEISPGEWVVTYVPGTTLGELAELIEDNIAGLAATIEDGEESDPVDYSYAEFDVSNVDINFGQVSATITLAGSPLPTYESISFILDSTLTGSPASNPIIDKSTDNVKVYYSEDHTYQDLIDAFDLDGEFSMTVLEGFEQSLIFSSFLSILAGGNLETPVNVSMSFANNERRDDGFVSVSIEATANATIEQVYNAIHEFDVVIGGSQTSGSQILSLAVNGTPVESIIGSTDLENVLKLNSNISFPSTNFIPLTFSGAGSFSISNFSSITLSEGSDGNTSNAAAIITAIDEVFGDPELIDISLIFAHKLYGSTAAVVDQAIDTLTQNRRDCVGFISTPLETATLSGDAQKKNATIEYLKEFNSSYLVLDAGVRYVYNRYTDRYVWVPGSASVAGLCARTDSIADPWFSPAGFNRGVILDTVKLGYNPKQADRDDLYKIGINSIVTFPGLGTVLYGDKTAQKKPSAFDRINVRRLFIVIQKAISTAAKFQLFELNDEFTRAMFRNMVEPFLRDVKGRRGITDFLVVCDATNNTGEVIDSNRFVGDIYIKPARSINFIQLNTIATRTGVEFSELIVRNN